MVKSKITTYIIYSIIIALSLGGLGGSYQASRIIILFATLLILKKLKYHSKNNIYKLGMYAYSFTLIYGVISLSWSALPLEGLRSELIVMLIGMISLPVFFQEKDNPNKETIIRNAWTISLIIVSALGLYEYVTDNHFTGYGERVLGGEELLLTTYISVFFGNYNNYNAYVSLAFPFLLWNIFEERKKLYRSLYMITAVFIIFSVFVNTSKMAMALIIIYVSSFLFLNLKSRKKKYFSALLIIAIPILFYNIINLDLIKEALIYRLSDAFTSNDESTIKRLSVLYGGLEMLMKTVGLGVGAGSFEASILSTDSYAGLTNPHNLIIELLSQYGIITFLLYLVWFFYIYKSTNKNSSLSKNGKLATKIAILSIPLVGLLNSHALGYTYWWVFFSSLALLSSHQKQFPLKS